MNETILTSSEADLTATLGTLNPSEDAFMFLERVPTCWLDDAEVSLGIQLTTYDSATDWSQWERGRVFCHQWELRWERLRAVYTGLPTTLPGYNSPLELPDVLRREVSYYLWGERNGNRFIELQVARVLAYPVANGQRVKLHVAEWHDKSGEPIASRFTGLEGVG